MKKSIICLVSLLCLALGFTSCEKKQSAGKTNITYYAEIVLNGDATMVVGKGTTFVDPGFKATMKGEDVTDKVTVTSTVDTSTSGIYSITYSIVNADGFLASTSRTVIVLDLTDPVEGFWACTPTSFREYNGNKVEYGASFQILIIQEEPGIYYVDDLFAGWYCQRAGYGDAYSMEGYVGVAGDGTISLLASKIAGWGDSLDALNDGKFDATNKTITYQAVYNGGTMFFNVTLNKVDL